MDLNRRRGVNKIGMIHGRFQPFHNGHLTYARLAKKRCDFLIVGITNPDPGSYIAMSGDSKRHLAVENPFTFYERLLMINRSLKESGFDPDSFNIVPFPIDNPDLWAHYAPDSATMFLRDRGEWTKTKVTMLESRGWKTELLNDSQDLDIHGIDIRAYMTDNNQAWESFVPRGTASVISDVDIRSRNT